MAVGFNSHSYFSHCFRQHFGKTPSEFLLDKK
jgi:AraC-like DNA-binding protein